MRAPRLHTNWAAWGLGVYACFGGNVRSIDVTLGPFCWMWHWVRFR